MITYLLVMLAAMIICTFSPVQAQNGFVVWTQGRECDGELQFNKLTYGKVGPKHTAVTKAEGSDIWVHISYDGEWIAFGRFIGRPDFKYGACDYHSFDETDIYVAKIENGKNIPAKAIRVDHGYWPSWAMDENAKDPSKPKLLYYTRYSDQSIRKAVINPDGTIASKDIMHSETPKKVQGTSAHTQGSPDGRYIAYRPSSMKIYDNKLKMDIPGAGGAGCHPGWGPRSKYLIWAKNMVCRIEDGQTTMKYTKAGVGSLWQGISNDVKYDQDTLYVIARMGNTNNSNNSFYIAFRPVDISNGGWNVGKETKVGNNGSSCDIHIFFEPLVVTAPTTKISIGSKLELTASLKNEKGEILNRPVTWTVNGGGLLKPTTGKRTIFISDGTEGEFSITAKSGDDEAKVNITVYDPSKVPVHQIRINCGGPDVGDWEAGNKFVTGGEDRDLPRSIALPNDTNAAPREVYFTSRTHSDYSGHSYTFDVPDESYIVRIHYAGYLKNREFYYAIEGKDTLVDFSPVINTNLAVIKTFNVEVTDGNGLTIEAWKNANNIFESGIEVVSRKKMITRSVSEQITKLSPKALITRLSNDVANVAIPFSGPHTVQLIGLNGTILQEFKGVSATEYKLGTGEAAGGYLLRVSGNNRIFLKKVILR